MSSDLEKLTIAEARKKLDAGDITAVELAESYLKAIEAKNPELNAYLGVYEDVLEQARAADEKLKTKKLKRSVTNKLTNLTGIPIALKDNILVKGEIASAASKILENYTASYDATVTTRLKSAGTVLLGRTNLDEFAMGASTENSAFGVTKNPHDTSRVAGGSSGGSAAAVAAGLALGALGSDTGGSIRQPAALCGVVGLKPTYGAVSRHGLIALGSSLDCIGPLTKTVEDAEILFEVIQGKDALDSTTVEASGYGAQKKEVKTIGVPSFVKTAEGIDERVRENFEASVKKLQDLGYTIQDIELPNAEYAVPVYYIILPAEASANLARFDGMRYGLREKGSDLLGTYLKTRGEGFGPEPRRRIILGTYVLSAGYYDAYYNRAGAVRRMITDDFMSAFKNVDVVVLPTTVGPAFPIGEKTDDPVKMYLEDVFTALANLTGLPALSVPSGTIAPTPQKGKNNKVGVPTSPEASVGKEGGKELPLGLQLIAPHMHEHLLFDVGKKFESVV